MCMYVCMYIYRYRYRYIYCMYIYLFIYVYTYTYTYTCKYIHTHKNVKGALCAQVIRLRVSYNQNDETRSRNSLRYLSKANLPIVCHY